MSNVILIKHPKNWGLSEEKVKKSALLALKVHGYTDNIELSISFVGRDRAKKLNWQYRQQKYIPQVLGFPMSMVADNDGLIRLGDIVICTQKLKYEAKFQKSTIDKVLAVWLKHGVENLIQ